MSISFSGLASGLDTASWVTSLTALKQAKVTTLQKESEQVITARDTLANIKSFFATFRSKIEKITDSKFNIATMDVFSKKIAQTSAAAKVTATAKADAVEGTYEVKVNQLATNTQVQSGYRYKTTVITTTQATDMSALKHLGITSGDITVKHGDYLTVININANENMASLLGKFQDAGIAASFDNNTGVFSFDVGVEDVWDTGLTGFVDKLHLVGVNHGYKTDNTLEQEEVETTYRIADRSTSLTDIGLRVASGTVRDVVGETKLKDLGVSSGYVKLRGEYTAEENFQITDNTTLNEFVAAINRHGTAEYNDTTGALTISGAIITPTETSSSDVVSKLSNNAKSSLGLEDSVSWTLGNAVTASNNIVVEANGQEYTFEIELNDTLGDLLDAMHGADIVADVQDGVFTMQNAVITSAGTTGLFEVFNLHDEVSNVSQTTQALQYHTVYIETTTATLDSYMSTINGADFNAGDTVIVKNEAGSSTTITLNGGARIRDLKQGMEQAGLTVDFTNGVMTIDNGWIIGGTYDITGAFGLEYTTTPSIVTGGALAETITTHATASLDSKLVGDLGATTGNVKITDSSGQAHLYNVTNNATLQDFLNTVEGYGLSATYDNVTGVVTLHGGTYESVSGGSNLYTVMFGEATPSASSYDSASSVSQALRLRTTVTVEATNTTTLSNLGITNQNVTFNGDKTVSINSSWNMDQLVTNLRSAGLDASFNAETHKLTVEGASYTGATGNFGTKMNFVDTITSRYATSNTIVGQSITTGVDLTSAGVVIATTSTVTGTQTTGVTSTGAEITYLTTTTACASQTGDLMSYNSVTGATSVSGEIGYNYTTSAAITGTGQQITYESVTSSTTTIQTTITTPNGLGTTGVSQTGGELGYYYTTSAGISETGQQITYESVTSTTTNVYTTITTPGDTTLTTTGQAQTGGMVTYETVSASVTTTYTTITTPGATSLGTVAQNQTGGVVSYESFTSSTTTSYTTITTPGATTLSTTGVAQTGGVVSYDSVSSTTTTTYTTITTPGATTLSTTGVSQTGGVVTYDSVSSNTTTTYTTITTPGATTLTTVGQNQTGTVAGYDSVSASTTVSTTSTYIYTTAQTITTSPVGQTGTTMSYISVGESTTTLTIPGADTFGTVAIGKTGGVITYITTNVVQGGSTEQIGNVLQYTTTVTYSPTVTSANPVYQTTVTTSTIGQTMSTGALSYVSVTPGNTTTISASETGMPLSYGVLGTTTIIAAESYDCAPMKTGYQVLEQEIEAHYVEGQGTVTMTPTLTGGDGACGIIEPGNYITMGQRTTAQVTVTDAASLANAISSGYTVIGIATAEALVALSTMSNNSSQCYNVKNKTYILTNNIDMSSVSNYTAICSASDANGRRFSGTFDGNYYTISNFTSSGIYGGMIGNTHSATIKNLVMEDVNVSSSTLNAGGIVSYMYRSKIENCAVVGGNITSSSANAGGIVGHSHASTIDQCYTSATVTANGDSSRSAGGIVGLIGLENNTSSLSHCIAESFVSGPNGANTGGIAGKISGSSYSVRMSNSYAGGIITGSNKGRVVGSIASESTNKVYITTVYANSTSGPSENIGAGSAASVYVPLVSSNPYGEIVTTTVTTTLTGATKIGKIQRVVGGNTYSMNDNGVQIVIGRYGASDKTITLSGTSTLANLESQLNNNGFSLTINSTSISISDKSSIDGSYIKSISSDFVMASGLNDSSYVTNAGVVTGQTTIGNILVPPTLDSLLTDCAQICVGEDFVIETNIGTITHTIGATETLGDLIDLFEGLGISIVNNGDSSDWSSMSIVDNGNGVYLIDISNHHLVDGMRIDYGEYLSYDPNHQQRLTQDLLFSTTDTGLAATEYITISSNGTVSATVTVNTGTDTVGDLLGALYNAGVRAYIENEEYIRFEPDSEHLNYISGMSSEMQGMWKIYDLSDLSSNRVIMTSSSETATAGTAIGMIADYPVYLSKPMYIRTDDGTEIIVGTGRNYDVGLNPMVVATADSLKYIIERYDVIGISDAETLIELAKMSSNITPEELGIKTFVLTNDIDMHHENWDTGIFLDRHNFNGNGHTISDLTGSESLFTGIREGNVSNLNLQNAAISGSADGILAAVVSGGHISNCSIEGSLTTSSYRAGGIAGQINSSHINNCRVEVNVESSHISARVGGTAGLLNNSSINNTEVFGSATCTNNNSSYIKYCGGIAGEAVTSYLNNVYAGVTVSGGSGTYKGMLFGQNNNKNACTACTNVYVYKNLNNGMNIAGAGTQPNGGVSSVLYNPVASCAGMDMINVTNANDLNGAINSTNMIGIANASVLAELANIVNNGESCLGKTFILTEDIDLTSYSNWHPIGYDHPFAGNFDGNYHTISNLTSTQSGSVGLFGSLNDGISISNLCLSNVNINSTDKGAGAIAGFAEGFVSITNCAVLNGTVTAGQTAGGLIGAGVGHLRIGSCSADLNVTASELAGGLVGTIPDNTLVTNCISGGNISGDTACGIGGLDLSGIIVNSYVYSSLSGTRNEFAFAPQADVARCQKHVSLANVPDTAEGNDASVINVTNLGELRDALQAKGIGCTINANGSISLLGGDSHYIAGINQDLADILGWDYTLYESTETSAVYTTYDVTGSTTLSDMGLSGGYVYTGSGGSIYIGATYSINDVVSALTNAGCSASFSNGVFTYNSGSPDQAHTIIGADAALNSLFGVTTTAGNFTPGQNITWTQNISTTSVAATMSSTLGSLNSNGQSGASGASVVITQANGTNVTVSASAGESLQTLNSRLNSYGFGLSLDSNNRIVITDNSQQDNNKIASVSAGILTGTGSAYTPTNQTVTNTIAVTDTASSITLGQVGLNADNQVITTSAGSVTVHRNTTIGQLISGLSTKGIEATFDGQNHFYLAPGQDNYITDITSGIASVLGVSGGASGHSSASITHGTFTAAATDTMAQLGMASDGTIELYNGNSFVTVTIHTSDSINDLMSSLNQAGTLGYGAVTFNNNGQLSINPAEGRYILNMSPNLQSALNFSAGINSTYNVVQGWTENTTLGQLGLSNTVSASMTLVAPGYVDPYANLTASSAATLAQDIQNNSVIGIGDAAALQQLATIVNGGNDLSGKTIVLTNNIDLSSISNFTAIGTSSNRFKGTFDGNCYTISSLTTSGSTAGLFGWVNSATIRNVELRNVNVSGGEYSGGLAATAQNSTIENCAVVSGTIRTTSTSYYSAIGAGGLVGKTYNGTIRNCSTDVNAVIASTSNPNAGHAGGLVGTTNYTYIDNVYANASSISANYRGRLLGAQYGGTITNASVGEGSSSLNYVGYRNSGSCTCSVSTNTTAGVTNPYKVSINASSATTLGSIVDQINNTFGAGAAAISNNTLALDPERCNISSITPELEAALGMMTVTSQSIETIVATGSTSFGQLGFVPSETGYITVFSNGQSSQIAIGATTTLDQLRQMLSNKGVNTSAVNNGVMNLLDTGSGIITSITSNVAYKLGWNSGYGETYTTTESTPVITTTTITSTDTNTVYNTTFVNATGSTQLQTLGVRGDVTISTSNGNTVLAKTSTINNVVNALNSLLGNGSATFDANNHTFTINPASGYVISMSPELESVLGINAGNGTTYSIDVEYGDYVTTTVANTNTTYSTSQVNATGATKLSQLGLSGTYTISTSAGTVVVYANSSTTIDHLVTALNTKNVGASFANNRLTVTNADAYISSMPTELAAALKFNVGNGETYNIITQTGAASTTTVESQNTTYSTSQVNATGATKLSQLGLSGTYTISTSNGTVVVTANASTTIDNLVTALNTKSVGASFANNKLTILNNNGYVVSMPTELAAALRINTGNGETYNIITQTGAASTTTVESQNTTYYTETVNATGSTLLKALGLSGTYTISTSKGDVIVTANNSTTIDNLAGALNTKLRKNGSSTAVSFANNRLSFNAAQADGYIFSMPSELSAVLNFNAGNGETYNVITQTGAASTTTVVSENTTYYTSTVNATGSNKLADLGLTGTYTISTSNGTVVVTANSSTTIDNLVTALNTKNVGASFSGSRLTATNANGYIISMPTELAAALRFNSGNGETYNVTTHTGAASTTTVVSQNTTYQTSHPTATSSTTFAALGFNSNEKGYVYLSNGTYVEVSDANTIGNLKTALNNKGVTFDISSDGKITLGANNQTVFVTSMTSNLANALNVETGYGETYSTTEHYATAGTSTTLNNLGISNGNYTITGSVGTQVLSVNGNTTVNDVLTKIKAATGLNNSQVTFSNGKLTVSGTGNNYLISMPSELASGMKFNVGNDQTYNVTVVTSTTVVTSLNTTYQTTHPTATVSTTMADLGFKSGEKGYIYVSNGTYVEVNANSSISDIKTALNNKGITFNLSNDGKITLGNGNGTTGEGTFVTSMTSNLSNLLHVETGYGESYGTASHYTTVSSATTISDLGIYGTYTISTSKGDIVIKANETTMGGLVNALNTKNVGASLTNGKLTVTNSDGYILSMPSALASALSFDAGYGNTYTDTIVTATTSTTFGQLGIQPGAKGYITVRNENTGALTTITVESTTSLATLKSNLANAGVSTSNITNGVLSLTGAASDTGYIESMSTNIAGILGWNYGLGQTYNTTVSTKTATTATALSTIGLKADGVIQTNQGNITVGTAVTIGTLITALGQKGITASISASGTFSMGKAGDTGAVVSITPNLANALGDIVVGLGFTYTESDIVNNTGGRTTITGNTTFGDGVFGSGFTGGTITIVGSNGGNVVVNANTTVQNFMDQMNAHGYTATLVNGALSLTANGNNYILSDNGGILSRFNISGDTYSVNDKSLGETKITDLRNSSGTDLNITTGKLGVVQNGIERTITIEATDTLNTLTAKLANYGVSLSYGTAHNGELSFTTTGDTYLTTISGGSNFLSKVGATNWNAVHKVESQAQQYITNPNSVIATTTKVTELRDASGNSLGISTGTYQIISNGVSFSKTITSDTTLADMFADMSLYGISASIDSNGKISLGAATNTYLKYDGNSGESNMVDKLFKNWTYGNVYTSNYLDVVKTPTQKATRETKLSNLTSGHYTAGNLTVTDTVSGTTATISLTENETVGSFMDKLTLHGFSSYLNNNGQLVIQNDGSKTLRTPANGGSNVMSILGLNPAATWDQSGQYTGTTSTQSVEMPTTVAVDRDTALSTLGVTAGRFYIYSKGVRYEIEMSSDETVGSFFDTLNSYGLHTTLKKDGNSSTLIIKGKADSYIAKSNSAGASNIVEKLGISTYKQFNYDASLRTTEYVTTTIVASDETFVSDYDKVINGVTQRSEGTLAVEVDGKYSEIYINSYETFGSLLEKLDRAGIKASLKDGILQMETGNLSFSVISEATDSNLLSNLGLTYNENLGKFMASSEAVFQSVTTLEDRTLSVANFADMDTQLSLLNVSSGNLSVYRNGKKANIEVNANETLGQLRSRIASAYSQGDVDIRVEDGHLTFFCNDDDVIVQVGSSVDTTNLSTICGFVENQDGTVSSAKELYKINSMSRIMEAGIFRKSSDLNSDATAGTFTIGDDTFTIDETTTFASIIAQINASEKSNATAYWDSVDGKMVITSRTTGSSLVNIEAGTSNFTDLLGLTNTDRDKDGNAVVTRLARDAQQMGNNSMFSINGTRFSSTSNIITSDVSRINGITFNLKAMSEDEAVTITVGKDKEAANTAMQEFVDAYNELVTAVDEEVSKDGVLADQYTLKSIRNQIRSIIMSTFSGDSAFKSLAQIGISTVSASSGNVATSGIDTLFLDADTFLEQYNKDADSVRKLLVGDGTVDGIMLQIENIVENALTSASGYFSSADSSFAKTLESLNDKIARANKAAEAYKSRLENKFQSMDMLISKMQNQYSSFLGGTSA